MRAIFKREMRAYFASPVGYVVVAALLALYGFFYYQVMAIGSSSYITQVFSTMFMFSMMIMPIITMRSMSDDRKNKTDQALITAPVSVTGIVMGKFLAAFGVYFIANTLALLPAITMGFFSSAFPWGILFGNYIGTLLYGAAMISIGVFISGLTISQVIAAVSVIAALCIWLALRKKYKDKPLTVTYTALVKEDGRQVPYEFSWLSGETPPTDAEMKAEIERRRAARAAEETAQAEEKAPETEESGGASGVREQREAEADTQAAPEEEQAAPAQEAAADAAEKDGSDAEPKE